MLSAADNLVRMINAVFLIISIGLISGLIGTQTKHSSRVNFCMFAAVYGLVTDSLYGFLANFWTSLTYPAILLVLDFLNFIFTFVAATALAVVTVATMGMMQNGGFGSNTGFSRRRARRQMGIPTISQV
ncbi:Fhn1p [Saccharomyces cerevisiae]|nr:Fhn1p [Saccharomyces cerevisiae]